MQDRANVSADFLELMKQEIIEVIKKYIDVDESAIDVRMTNRQNEDGTNGAPALYANIPIMSIKDDVLRQKNKEKEQAEEIEIKDDNKSESKSTPNTEEEKNEAKVEENIKKVVEEIVEPIEAEKREETVNKE